MPILYYPVAVIYFWYFFLPKKLIHHFVDLIVYFIEVFSIPLLVKTFFKPLKNEYRGDLVLFSVFMGIAVKSLIIPICLALIGFLVVIEIFIFSLIMLIPFLGVYFMFL